MTRQNQLSNLQQNRAAKGLLVVAAAVGAMTLASGAQGATQTWDIDQVTANTQPGTGNWWDGATGSDPGSSHNWTNGPVLDPGAWVQGNTANFSSAAPQGLSTVTIFGNIQPLSITDSGAANGVTINRTDGTSKITLGTGGLSMTGNQGMIFNVPITLTTDTLFGGTGSITVNGVIDDGGSGYGLSTAMGGGIVTLTGANTYTGATTVNTGRLTLSGNGSIATSSALAVATGATATLDYSTNAAVNRVGDSVGVDLRGTLNFIGNTSTNVGETIGALTSDTNGTILDLSTAAAGSKNLTLTAASLSRAGNGTLVVRGTNIGVNAIADAVAGSTNIVLTSAPTLVGSGAANTTTTGVIPWAVGAKSSGGSAAGFLTYDSTNGLRLLNSSEYLTTLPDGNNTSENFQLANAVQSLTSATKVNSLTLTGNSTNLSGPGPLTVESGGILATGTTTINTGTLAFGSREGIIATSGITTIGSNITGSGGLTKAGSSNLILTSANGYSGVTQVNQGNLQVGGTTVGGTATGDLGSSSGLVLNGGSLVVNRSNAYNLSQNISGTSGTVTLSGAGTTTLSGTNAIPGAVTVNAGKLVVSGTTSTVGTSGDLKLNGNGTVLTVTGPTLSVGAMLGVGSATNGNAAVYQGTNTVITGAAQGTDTSLQVANGTGSYGFYSLSGGSLTSNFNNGKKMGVAESGNSTGIVYQSGGSVDVGLLRLGKGGTGATGVYYMTGGTLSTTTTLGNNANGSGIMTIAGTGTLNAPNTLTTGYVVGGTSNTTGILNLNTGGTLVGGIKTSGSGTGDRQVNFNGGTLQTGNIDASTNFLVNVYGGGATFSNSTAGTQTIAQPLVAPAGDGISGTTYTIASGGSGYIGAPLVTISGASGATAVANMVDDGSGNGTFKVASITITSPGINASSPTFSFSGGGTATPATPVALNTAPNVSGGINKLGTGILALNSVNTYAGNTTIQGGTLTLGSAADIASSAAVDVYAGATFDVSSKTTGYTINGLAGGGTVKGKSGQALTINNTLAPGHSVDTVTISAGNLNLADGATYAYEIDGDTASPISDLTNLTDGSSTVSFGTGPGSDHWSLSLANLGTVDPTGKEFVLFDYKGANPSSLGTWAINYGTTGWEGGLVSVDSVNTRIVLSGLTVAPVPEPASLGLLAFGAIGLLARQRRNRM